MQKTLHNMRRLSDAYGAERLCVRVQGCLHVGRRRDDREVRLHGLAEAAHVLLGRDDGGLLQGRVKVLSRVSHIDLRIQSKEKPGRALGLFDGR